ncbi:MAG: T9SS type A sorting domain-containing protein [Chlorobi bacterium]|nr:T9SS type A sorting domain-containing protein [Chlorobiota bacterium]
MKNNIFYTIILILLTFDLSAQEYTTFLPGNPQLININQKTAKEKSEKALLELPFWDDFSYPDIYPDADLWSDNQAYINRTLAFRPPSAGTATLDAVDSAGRIYEYADYNEVFYADSLTSLPVNLDYPGDNTVYFSFSFQPQGIGDQPEVQDSLILEFYAPEEDSWTKIWRQAGSPKKDFSSVIIPVNEDKYLKAGFMFRFINIASFGTSTYPTLATNCDFWHIDYVYLNRGRNATDTVFHDIAFTAPLHSLLNNYESVPWEHYKASPSKGLTDKIKVSYRNNDNVTRIIDSLNFILEDISGTSPDQKWYAGTSVPSPFTDYDVTFSPQPFNFPLNSNAEADFLLTAKIITDTYDSVQNNVISYTQKFRNYYAYDDGSAEAGYGIYGNGTKYGKVALKFSPLKDDYLTGVYMYFTRAFEDASQNYFWIYIWDVDENGLPGDTLKTIEGVRPEYENEINKFTFYEFDEPLQINGDFFIGWTQTTEGKLNIGFDFNNINNDKVFYNISGDWIQSAEQGSLMIRPAFGYSASEISEIENKKLKIFPNPASDFINIDFKRDYGKSYRLEIYNMQGKNVYRNNNFEDKTLNVGFLSKGLYILTVYDMQDTFTSQFVVE